MSKSVYSGENVSTLLGLSFSDFRATPSSSKVRSVLVAKIISKLRVHTI